MNSTFLLRNSLYTLYTSSTLAPPHRLPHSTATPHLWSTNTRSRTPMASSPTSWTNAKYTKRSWSWWTWPLSRGFGDTSSVWMTLTMGISTSRQKNTCRFRWWNRRGSSGMVGIIIIVFVHEIDRVNDYYNVFTCFIWISLLWYWYFSSLYILKMVFFLLLERV